MDNSQTPSQQVPVAQAIQQASVPVSTQPLTLDPNQMSEPNVSTTAASSSVVPQSIQQPQYPISGPHKETGPVMQAPVSEYLRPTEVVPQISAEAAEAGVEESPNMEQFQLTSEHTAVGIKHAGNAMPVAIPTQPAMQLPYTPLEAKEVVRSTSIAESKHWLASLTEFLLKKIQGVTH